MGFELIKYRGRGRGRIGADLSRTRGHNRVRVSNSVLELIGDPARVLVSYDGEARRLRIENGDGLDESFPLAAVGAASKGFSATALLRKAGLWDHSVALSNTAPAGAEFLEFQLPDVE